MKHKKKYNGRGTGYFSDEHLMAALTGVNSGFEFLPDLCHKNMRPL
jgi:hypothetical protein